MTIVSPNKSLQPTRDGAVSSAIADGAFWSRVAELGRQLVLPRVMSITPTASVSMREFLRTGEFGPVRLGDSVDSLRSIFGEPPIVDCTSRRHRTPGIWKYGDIEFHLTSDRKNVCLIFCDTFEQLELGSAAVLDRWFFEGHPPVELVERELASAGIGFRRLDMLHEPSGFLLRLDCGVELMFSRGSDPVMWPGVPGLFGFQYADRNAS